MRFAGDPFHLNAYHGGSGTPSLQGLFKLCSRVAAQALDQQLQRSVFLLGIRNQGGSAKYDGTLIQRGQFCGDYFGGGYSAVRDSLLMRQVFQLVSLERAVQVQDISGQHVIQRNGIRPPVFSHRGQYPVFGSRQDCAGRVFAKSPVSPAHFSEH
jgi:hypothetical protein